MSALWVLVLLVWIHFFADFVLQTDAMALNKSKSNRWLALHVAVYSVCLLPFGWRFAAINAAAHFSTDWVSSRATSRLWIAGERHWFFVVIGADQALHLTALFLTCGWLNG